MPSLSGDYVRRTWRYDLAEDFHKLDLTVPAQGSVKSSSSDDEDLSGSFVQVARPSGPAESSTTETAIADELMKEAANWSPSSPHVFQPRSSPAKDDPSCTHFIPFSKLYDAWVSHSFNSTRTLLAIAQTSYMVPDDEDDDAGPVVEIYDLTTSPGQSGGGMNGRRILRGHRGKISSILFSPTDPCLLVTSSEPDMRARRRRGKQLNAFGSEIIIWDLSPTSRISQPPTIPDSVLEASAENAVETIVNIIGRHSSGQWGSIQFAEGETAQLQKDIHISLLGIVFSRLTGDVPKLHGRIPMACRSEPFSKDGRKVLYMPGDTPNSNGIDDR